MSSCSIPETPEDVAKLLNQWNKSSGYDRSNDWYDISRLCSREINPFVKERLAALVETVKDVPTLAEGGINLNNYQAFRDRC